MGPCQCPACIAREAVAKVLKGSADDLDRALEKLWDQLARTPNLPRS